jgi:hypothetical protein
VTGSRPALAAGARGAGGGAAYRTAALASPHLYGLYLEALAYAGVPFLA